MKDLYALRIAVVSLEFLVVLVGAVLYFYVPHLFVELKDMLAVEAEMMKWLALLPLTLMCWILKEVRDFIRDDKESEAILVSWDGYWKLKCHLYVSVVYGVIFAVLAIASSLKTLSEESVLGLACYLVATVGTIIVGGSLYFAKMELREAMAKVRAL